MKTYIYITLFAGIFLLDGCDASTVKTIETQPTNRFLVRSAEYVRVRGQAPNISIYIVEDTQGTNNFLLVDTQHGVSMKAINKPDSEHR
jgi:hypothetical protein